MDLRIMEKPDHPHFVQNLLGLCRVEGVKRKNGAFVYGSIHTPDELALDFDCTRYPPKKYFFPPKETLFQFSTTPSPETVPVFESQPLIIYGIHPYDLKAINQMDRIFSNGTPDPNYLKRRTESTLIGVDPTAIAPRSFWADMGAAGISAGFDLMFTDISDGYVIEIGTEKGENLLTRYGKVRDASKNEAAKRIEIRTRMFNMSHIKGLEFPNYEIPKLLERSHDHHLWAENAARCLSCGSCNLVCPTCYCFDVADEMELDLSHGARFRRWDGCLLKDFAKVATGENFRESRTARYRHRFYRKGLYLQQILNDFACVGCGRCAAACLPDIADPVKVFNTLMEA